MILRVANDVLPDESHAVGNFANNADADEAFLSKNRGAYHRTEKQEVFEKYDYRH